jgi:DNA-binding Xre family transcriptional regulator
MMVVTRSLTNAVSLRVEQLLRERNMTRYALCKKVGLSQASLHHIMAADCDGVNLKMIYWICSGLDVSFADFFNSPFLALENCEPNT